MIGTKDCIDPCGPLRLIEVAVARNLGGFADLRYRARDIGVAVAINHQARIGLQDQRRIQQARKLTPDGANADIPCNMPQSFGFRQTERAEPARESAPGMLAG